jgi:hypothetical protein
VEPSRDPSTQLVIELLHRRHALSPDRALAVLVGAARRKGVEVRDIVGVILHQRPLPRTA